MTGCAPEMVQQSTFATGAGMNCVEVGVARGVCFLLWGEPGRCCAGGGGWLMLRGGSAFPMLRGEPTDAVGGEPSLSG